jgi:hypothetical protein
MLGISWVAAQLAASQEGLSSMSELVKTSVFRVTIRNQRKLNICILQYTPLSHNVMEHYI